MTSLPDTPCLLNGQLLPLNQAKVSVLDRGFIFGDGVYEVIPVYGRRLFRFDEHMARLARSLDKLRIANPHSRDEWLRHARTLVTALPADDQAVYLQENMTVRLSMHDGVPVASELPQRVVLEVTETEPTTKGQTASSSYKPAILSNGVRTLVPPHISAGTRIVVMTADGSYAERAKE